jgi:hypothetical protein
MATGCRQQSWMGGPGTSCMNSSTRFAELTGSICFSPKIKRCQGARRQRDATQSPSRHPFRLIRGKELPWRIFCSAAAGQSWSRATGILKEAPVTLGTDQACATWTRRFQFFLVNVLRRNQIESDGRNIPYFMQVYLMTSRIFRRVFIALLFTGGVALGRIVYDIDSPGIELWFILLMVGGLLVVVCRSFYSTRSGAKWTRHQADQPKRSEW